MSAMPFVATVPSVLGESHSAPRRSGACPQSVPLYLLHQKAEQVLASLR